MSNNLTPTLRAYNNQLPQLASSVYIDPTATLLGDVTIGEHSSIWPMVTIRADVNTIRIGKHTNIQDGSVLHVTRPHKSCPQGYPCIVGDNVTVGHRVVLHGCSIGNRVLIGMGAILLDGAIIEDNVLIGAGTLVTAGKRLTSGYLYLGSPAQRVRPLSNDEMAYFVESANNYVNLKTDYMGDEA